MFIYYRWRVSQGWRSTCSRELSKPLASPTRSPWETEAVLISCTNFPRNIRWPQDPIKDRFVLWWMAFVLLLLAFGYLEWVFGAKAPDEWFGLCKMASGNIYSLRTRVFFFFFSFPFSSLCSAEKKSFV